jgi:hypothetical protein
MKSHMEISQRPEKSMKIPLGNHTKNVQRKASNRIRRPEEEAEFIHRQRKKRRRKSPDQYTVAGQEGKLRLMHNQLLSPLLDIFPINNTSSPFSHENSLGNLMKSLEAHKA